MSFDIVGVGAAAYDYLCIVEKYPEEDGSTNILAIHNQGGGCVATALVAASRLGSSTAYIGNTGDNFGGNYIRDDFVREGVDISGVQIFPGKHSTEGYVMIDPVKSTRTKFPYSNDLPDITWTREKEDLIRQAKILHIDGTNYNNCLRAAQIARESGVLVSLDGCGRKKNTALNAELAMMADILIMNEEFPYYASGKDNLEEALKFFTQGHAKVIISTLGAKGCVALEYGKLVYYPAYKVEAVDTTGAGDVFHGAFMDAWLRSYTQYAAVLYASAVAAMKCRQIGGRAGIPNHEETLQFMKEHAEDMN